MFSHAQQAETRQSEQQAGSAERGRSSSTERGKRSNSRPRGMHCFRFLKGTCDAGDSCRWVHATAEEVKAKGAQSKTKRTSSAVAEATPDVALVCVQLDSDSDPEDDGYQIAVVCPERFSTLMDEDEDRMIIGRRHPRSRITASRNLRMPDEFTDSKTRPC